MDLVEVFLLNFSLAGAIFDLKLVDAVVDALLVDEVVGVVAGVDMFLVSTSCFLWCEV